MRGLLEDNGIDVPAHLSADAIGEQLLADEQAAAAAEEAVEEDSVQLSREEVDELLAAAVATECNRGQASHTGELLPRCPGRRVQRWARSLGRAPRQPSSGHVHEKEEVHTRARAARSVFYAISVLIPIP